MTSLHLIGKGKMNQKATLLLLEHIERLRAADFKTVQQGQFIEDAGQFRAEWCITDNTPYFGTKQIQVRVKHIPSDAVVVESIFYRSEG